MDAHDREHLRIIISVTLGVASKQIKRAYVDRCDELHDTAKRDLSQPIANTVLQHFDLRRKPDEGGPGLHSRSASS